jgi:hypothetical protein
MLLNLILLLMTIIGSTYPQTSNCLIPFCETCHFIQSPKNGFKGIKSCSKCSPFYNLVEVKVEDVASSNGSSDPEPSPTSTAQPNNSIQPSPTGNIS